MLHQSFGQNLLGFLLNTNYKNILGYEMTDSPYFCFCFYFYLERAQCMQSSVTRIRN